MATASSRPSSRNPDNIIQPTPVDSNNRFGLPKKPQIPKWDDIIRLSPNSLNYLRNNPKPNINSANGAPELNLASPRTNAPTPRPLSSRLTPHPIQSFQSAKPDPQIETEQLMTMLKQTSPITNLTSDLRQQQQTTSELLSRIDQLTELQQQQVKSISTFDQQLQSAKATMDEQNKQASLLRTRFQEIDSEMDALKTNFNTHQTTAQELAQIRDRQISEINTALTKTKEQLLAQTQTIDNLVALQSESTRSQQTKISNLEQDSTSLKNTKLNTADFNRQISELENTVRILKVAVCAMAAIGLFALYRSFR